MSNFNPYVAYSAGLVGCIKSPRADEEFVDSILRRGGEPDGGNVAHAWEFADAGKGVLTLLFPKVTDVFPDCWPGPTQLTGDCFPAGTMVRMADGTEKPIESVQKGEVVLSHQGNPQPVEETIKKPYRGDLLTVSLKSAPRAVTCTPDHRIVAGGEGSEFWCRADLLTTGTKVLLPRHAPAGATHTFDLQDSPHAVIAGAHGRNMPPSSESVTRWKSMKHECNRHITLDSRLAWLVGLYIAEGSCDVSVHGDSPRRITLNLSSNERLLAEQAASLFFEIFGVAAHVTSVPSKPSVIYVRCSSPPIASLFKALAPGNTYTKRLNPLFFSAAKSVRLAVLRGWFAGDGHLGAKRTANAAGSHDSVLATAVSVSHGLVCDMFDIANSCAIASSVTRRKPRNRSLAAANLSMYGENAIQVYPGCMTEYHIKPGAAKKDGRLGAWKEVSGVERVAFDGEVYCLQVANDHSFVANGVAVHNCVARATANCLLTSMGLEIADQKPDEVTGLVEGAPELPTLGVMHSVVASESLWAWRGYDGDGWICSKAAQVATTQGFLIRKPYPGLNIDLTKYTDDTIALGGSRPPSLAWLTESKQHLARAATVLEGREQVRSFLAQGYGVFNCSSMGFERTRNEDGFSRQIGTWQHAQCYIGYDDRPETHQKYGQALVLWLNSWNRWNTGPRLVRGTNIEIPHGAYWALASTTERARNIALSSVAGWPRRQHTTYGAGGNV